MTIKVKKKPVVLFIMSLLILLLFINPLSVFAADNENDKVADYLLPLVSNKATSDQVSYIATNDKGTILVTSLHGFLDITYDYGKTWQSRKLPRDANYNLQYNNGLFYLSVSDYKGTESYYSTDGITWSSFTLRPPTEVNLEGSSLYIKNVFTVNGKWVLSGSGRYNRHSYIFTSNDGKKWEYAGVIPTNKPFHLLWNGQNYSAIMLYGYMFVDKDIKNNKYRHLLGPQGSAELIVYTSHDLKNWKQISGLTPGNTYYYSGISTSQTGIFYWYDLYSNELSSTDGINFKIKKLPKALQTNDYRSPIYKKGNIHYVFMNNWISSGVVHTKVLTSNDKLNWKETKINVLNSMVVIQSGNKFIGYGHDDEGKIVMSDDGIHWKRIK